MPAIRVLWSTITPRPLLKITHQKLRVIIVEKSRKYKNGNIKTKVHCVEMEVSNLIPASGLG
jgi:hypothetical protein